jgi:CRP-like cAMP-binding protein
MNSCQRSAALADSAPAPNASGFCTTDNYLLAALPEAERRHISVSLELVPVHPGQTLRSPSSGSSHVYFPLNCIVSMIYTTQGGGTAEVAMIGCEGMVGFGMFIGGSCDGSEAVVQCHGFAYRIRLSSLKEYFNRSPAVRALLMQYMESLLVQCSRTALCNRHHTVEQQLCRWLLLAMDRLGSEELSMTQEAIAGTLGVRRVGITEAASRLQKDGLIHYHRGKVSLANRAAMERRACECYRAQKQELLRIRQLAYGQGANRKGRDGAAVMAAAQATPWSHRPLIQAAHAFRREPAAGMAPPQAVPGAIEGADPGINGSPA